MTRRLTNPDCVDFGHVWSDWWTEDCRCGEQHLFRVCDRCELPDDDPVCRLASTGGSGVAA